VAAIIFNARAHRAKLEKVARRVSVRLGIAAGENGVDKTPPDQGGGQQPTVRLGRFHQRSQHYVVAAVQLPGPIGDQLLRECGLLEREQQLGPRGNERTGSRILTGAGAECAALASREYLLQRSIRVNSRRLPLELSADVDLPVSIPQQFVGSIQQMETLELSVLPAGDTEPAQRTRTIVTREVMLGDVVRL